MSIYDMQVEEYEQICDIVEEFFNFDGIEEEGRM